MPLTNLNLQELGIELEGELETSELIRSIYSTDASEYREVPLGVVYPKSEQDVIRLVQFAAKHAVPLIPRAGGTSLAGQTVGSGLVVDVSRHMNRILSIDESEGIVVVEPGVIRDDLNAVLRPMGLFFPPVTSTSNRATLGGMVGNNSCGSNSIKYGSTREYVLGINAVLSNGEIAEFGPVSVREMETFAEKDSLEGRIYHVISALHHSIEAREEIESRFPKPSVQRRNTGYALDRLLGIGNSNIERETIDLCQLLCGSEGTLAFTTKIKLKVLPLPPPHTVLVAAHFAALADCWTAASHIVKHGPYACELMDDAILDCAREHRVYRNRSHFVQGNPKGIIAAEFRGDTLEEAVNLGEQLIRDLEVKKLGYAHLILKGQDVQSLWELRTAGLGLLANLPKEAKAVACVEDTAVAVEDLPEYIGAFDEVMAKYGQKSIYYAHIGAGELHLRPLLDLRKKGDVQLFSEISEEVAHIVKKFRGSISGEHGDGRVRSPLFEIVLGKQVIGYFESIKQAFDPQNLFNPGKIVRPKPMTTDLRQSQLERTQEIDTFLDFTSLGGFSKALRQCNGSGDCRKSSTAGGTMCPSYHATRAEIHTTRGRANALREILLNQPDNPALGMEKAREALDLCLSCKACSAECPSNVDMAAFKAEVMHQYYRTRKRPLRDYFFTHSNSLLEAARRFPLAAALIDPNFRPVKALLHYLGITHERTLPRPSKMTVKKWFEKNKTSIQPSRPTKTVALFLDEFTNQYELELGIKTIKLLCRLNYKVIVPPHVESGRAALSKAKLDTARKYAEQNIRNLRPLLDEGVDIVGIEPSAILSFRDEYPKLVKASLKEAAGRLQTHVRTIEEFLADEFSSGAISREWFTSNRRSVIYHGHCHQKALSDQAASAIVLSIPPAYSCTVLQTGCCGMAGSFGYERDHFDLSMKIGELSLFPAVRTADENTVIAASGFSCRHQIADGTGKRSYHPVEILFDALAG